MQGSRGTQGLGTQFQMQQPRGLSTAAPSGLASEAGLP